MTSTAITTRDPDQLLSIIDELSQTNNLLQQKIYYLTHKQYGSSSEKLFDSQTSLFDNNQATQLETNSVNTDSALVSLTDKKDEIVSPPPRPRRPRKDVFEGLPHQRIEIDIPEHEKVCDGCGGELHRIGEDIKREVDYIPAKLTVKKLVHIKYGCRQCEIGVKRAPMAPSLLPKSYASVNLLVYLIIAKFADHLPLYRLEQQFKRLGFTLPRSTQCQWLMEVAHKLKPLIPLMADSIRAGLRIWTDDTVIGLANDDPNRHRTIQARLWSYIGGQIDQPNTVVYDFTRTRQQCGPANWLKGYKGYLIADAYAGYDHLFKSGDIKEVACWAHVRRKFFEATLGVKNPHRAHWVVAQIKELAIIEHKVNTLPMAQRQYYRRRHAKQITQALYQWMQNHAGAVIPKSPLGKAIHYMNNNWRALTRYVTQGYLTSTNNTAEQTMRPIAIGRKNYLFVGSERGGEAAAIFYSLIQTCKSHEINVQDYLTTVLTRLPMTPKKELGLLLPSNYRKRVVN